jgi:hypothetical protein
MEEEINTLDVSMKKDWKGNTSCVSKILRENRDGAIECNDCDKADAFKGKKRKEDQVDYVHQERSGGESRLRLDLCETGVAVKIE